MFMVLPTILWQGWTRYRYIINRGGGTGEGGGGEKTMIRTQIYLASCSAKEPRSQANAQKHPQMLVSTPCTAIPQHILGDYLTTRSSLARDLG